MSPECWRNNWNEYQWLSRYLVLCIWFLAVQICTWSGMMTMTGWMAQFSTLLFSIFIDGFPISGLHILSIIKWLRGTTIKYAWCHKFFVQTHTSKIPCIGFVSRSARRTGVSLFSQFPVDLETHLRKAWSFRNLREGPYLVESGYYHFHQLVRIVS